MRERRRFPIAFLAAFCAALAVYAGVSLALDPLRVFGTSNFNRKNFEPETRYLQIRHLERDPRPNAFVLGSSRVNFYDVGLLDRLTRERFYNLSAPIDGFQGIRRKAAWLIAHRHVVQVVIGLDYDLYDVVDDRADLQHVDAPEINGQWPVAFYARDLLLPPELLRDCVVGNLSPGVGYHFDPGNGQYTVAEGTFAPGEHLVQRQRLDRAAALAELRQTLALLDAAGVRHVEIVPPFSERRLMQFPTADYLRWLRDVVAISGDVWMFGDDNGIARDLRNYLDISHFDRHVGDLVLARVFRGHAAGAPAEFGTELTPRNLAAELKRVGIALADARERTRTATDEVAALH